MEISLARLEIRSRFARFLDTNNDGDYDYGGIYNDNDNDDVWY